MDLEDINSVLKYLKVKYKEANDFYMMKTVCHGGNSDKLYLYKNTLMFVCYTHCGNMNVYQLISKVKHVSIGEAHNIFDLVTKGKKINSFSFVDSQNPMDKFKKKDVERESVEFIDPKILNIYYDLYSDDWIKQGISMRTQDKFGIKFSITDNAIIIPHKFYNGKLIGVRERNFDKYMVDEGRKYMPVYYHGKSLRYPIRENLYGLYENKKSICSSRKIILFEAEKSVMMLDSFYNGQGNGVALSGSSLSNRQIELISNLPIDEVIVGLDKEYSNDNVRSEDVRKQMIEKKFSKLSGRFAVSVLWDLNNLLDKKDSPTDKGKKIFEKLMKQRLFL